MIDRITNSKPVRAAKALDQEVLRQYSKIAKRWEDKGRNIYALSSAVGIPSQIGLIAGSVLTLPPRLGTIISNLYFIDTVYNVAGMMGMARDESDSISIAVNPMQIISTKFNRLIRFPTFLSTFPLLGRVGYDIYNYFVNSEPITQETAGLALDGLSALGLASSMYLKDRNPRLLQKDPLWKKAYETAKDKFREGVEGIKEKIGGLVPSPQPVPVQASYRQGLENYLGE